MENTKSEEALRALEATVDSLLDPPGCEWNRSQTHRSLVTYLVEESFELVEAIEDGTVDDLREELGDVLYQVVLHAGIAERAGEGFGLAEVMAEVDEKIRRRHPHVFGDDTASDVDDIVRLWSLAKAREKKSRASAYDGVPVGLPALARAQKVAARAEAERARRGEGAGSCPLVRQKTRVPPTRRRRGVCGCSRTWTRPRSEAGTRNAPSAGRSESVRRAFVEPRLLDESRPATPDLAGIRTPTDVREVAGRPTTRIEGTPPEQVISHARPRLFSAVVPSYTQVKCHKIVHGISEVSHEFQRAPEAAHGLLRPAV
ncbi:MazG nucleotide pyrophosphohydrolase domain-containing protein [Frondihabitans sucicola]|uniref:MazG nucleotide pyrophosphohydrolase domain-containing protein n=1 Tax=Frondihabitans sucicola TaxID=1268041 RepID=UPI002573A91A|nr:MazG nucleotide pyrophosphohydrolase domain-containing protein [Frondihabitans sucicola]